MFRTALKELQSLAQETARDIAIRNKWNRVEQPSLQYEVLGLIRIISLDYGL
jgi:hypothetical protein